MNENKQVQHPQNTGELIKHIAKKIPERLLKALPMTIAFGVISWLLHTFLLVYVNEGFNPDTWLGKNLLNVKGSFLSSTLLWTMIGASIPMIILFFKRGGNPFKVIVSIVKIPSDIVKANKSTNGRYLPYICFACAVTLLIDSILSGISSMVAGGLIMSSVVAFSTGRGSIFIQVLRMILQDIQMYILKRQKFKLDAKSVMMIIGISGTTLLIFGFIKALPTPWIILLILRYAWFAIAVLGVVILVNNNNKVLKQFMFFIGFVGTAYLLYEISIIKVFADDGGWVESGSTFSGWITSEGAITATLNGLPPAIGGIVGAYISIIINGLSSGLGTISSGINGVNGDFVSPDENTETDGEGNTITTKSDGTVITVKPDGTTITARPDGSKEATAPDGTTATLSPDGIQTTYNPDGSVIVENPDGTAVQTNTDGSTTTLNTDGTQTIKNNDGSVVTVGTDGSMTYIEPDGSSETYNENDILVSKTLPSGATGNYDPDGNLTGGTMSNGSPFTVGPDGTLSTTIDGINIKVSPDGIVSGKGKLPDGTELIINEDRSIYVKLASGDTASFDPDGYLTKANLIMPDGRKVGVDGTTGVINITNKDGDKATVNPDGSCTYEGHDDYNAEIDADGNLTEKYPDGTTVTVKTDGNAQISQPDGTEWNVNPDGTGTATQPDGTVWTAKTDGTTHISKTDGTNVTISKDGTVNVTHPDGRNETILPKSN